MLNAAITFLILCVFLLNSVDGAQKRERKLVPSRSLQPTIFEWATLRSE